MNPGSKRGGQPGNLNALKNGFYSRCFRELENADLQATGHSLKDEIRMLRVLIRRMFDLASHEDGELEQMADCLNTLGMASSRLAALLRTEQKLNVEHNDLTDSLNQALAETIQALAADSTRRKGERPHDPA